jgi:hypothetical protein
MRSCREKQLDHVAKISLAAYRLLDPRRRAQVGERVVLSYPLDRHEAEPIQLAPLQILQVPRRLDSWQWTHRASATHKRSVIMADVSNPASVRFGVTDQVDSEGAIAGQVGPDPCDPDQSASDQVVSDRALIDEVIANEAANNTADNNKAANNQATSDELVQTRQIVRYLRLVRRREWVKRRNRWLIRLMGPLLAMLICLVASGRCEVTAS